MVLYLRWKMGTPSRTVVSRNGSTFRWHPLSAREPQTSHLNLEIAAVIDEHATSAPAFTDRANEPPKADVEAPITMILGTEPGSRRPSSQRRT